MINLFIYYYFMVHIGGAICVQNFSTARETFCPCCSGWSEKAIQNVKYHRILLSILHYFHYSSITPMHGFIYDLIESFYFWISSQTQTHTHSHTPASDTFSFLLSLSLLSSLPLSLTLSLFPSPLSFVVIPLNHYRGPSLFVELSHPSLHPRLPFILLLSHSLS